MDQNNPEQWHPSYTVQKDAETPSRGQVFSWKRVLFVAALVGVLVGGGVTYYHNNGASDGDLYSAASNLESSSDEEWTEDEWEEFLAEAELMEGSSESDPYGYYEDYYTEENYAIEYSENTDYVTFIDYIYGYKIDFPGDWYFEPAYSGTLFMSEYEDAEDLFSELVSFSTEDLSAYPNMTLEEYADISLGYFLEDSAYAFEEQGYATLGGYDAIYFIGTYDFGNVTSGILDLFTLQDGMIYFFSYGYEMPEKEIYIEITDHMVESFELFKVKTPSGVESTSIPSGSFGATSLLHLRSE